MRPLNVLFLCTGNSARSILAEALASHLGRERIRAYSAGSHPKGVVHPVALQVLSEIGFDVAGLSSKPWDAFAGPDNTNQRPKLWTRHFNVVILHGPGMSEVCC